MIFRDYDDISSKDEQNYDDRIIDDDPFEQIFGDIHSIETVSSERYPEDRLSSMKLEQVYQLTEQCSNLKNLYGLRDIYTFLYNRYGGELYLLAISYLYGRTESVEELISILRRFPVAAMGMGLRELKESEKMLQIGYNFPNLSSEELDYVEEKYNDSKYCELIDTLFFDKDNLPRSISGITKKELNKKNSDFSDSLIYEIINAFKKNAMVETDDDDTEWFVYIRRMNQIAKKAYCDCGPGDFVASGEYRSDDLLDKLDEFDPRFSNYIIEKILARHHNEEYMNEMFLRKCGVLLHFDSIINFYKDYDPNNPERIKMLEKFLALDFLHRANGIKR